MTGCRIAVADEPQIILTKRQAEVLRCAAMGMGQKATAKALGLGMESVKSHRVAACKKLGAKGITMAAVIAAKAGVL